MATQQSPQQSDKNGHSFVEESSKSNDLSNSRSILAEILTMPEGPVAPQRFKYNKEQLVAISKTTGAKIRPHYLQLEFFNESGVWDPEKWVLNERNDDGKATSDEPKSKRERPADLERDAPLSGKRRSADPKERLKEEQDGIILSPQRRSFGTGCHVTQQLTTVSRRSESPPDLRASERDNHREPTRRIGSGRFFARDRDREREREYGYRNSSDRREHERGDVGRGERNVRGGGDRDRFRRDDRDSRSGREPASGKERDYDRRGSRDKGFRRIEEEEEPEWFSGGPTSQHETIELRGFDEPNDEDEARGKDGGSRRERRRSWRKPKTPTIEDIAERSEDGSETSEKRSQNGVESGTVKPNDTPRSVGEGDDDGEVASSSGFDFSDLFKFDTMSSMFPSAHATSPENVDSSLTGSRFGQFFRRETSPIQNNSSDTSRRSSFQDELIAPIIGNLSEHSDLISSPTSGSDTYFAPISPAQLTKSSSESSKQLLEMLQPNRDEQLFTENRGATLSEMEQSKDLQKLETDLKNLVLGQKQGSQHSSHGVPADANGQSSFAGPSAGSMNAFEKLLSQISDGRVTPASRSLNLSGFDSEDKKVVQASDFHVPSGQSKMHMMDILKHAPTEQDILNGFLQGNAMPSRLGASAAASTTSPPKSNDFLSLFTSQGCPPEATPSLDSILMNSLNKASNNSMKNHSPFVYTSTNADRQQQQPQQQQSPQSTSLQSSAGRSKSISVQQQQPPANSIQQQQREILAAILKQQQQQQQQVGPPRLPSPIQPPIIQRPCTSPNPLPQSHMANGPISPRSISPSHHECTVQHSYMHHQQRPNIPSPLVFRQDPPAISHAPSPIHPAQMVQSMAPVAPLNPNTLQVKAGHILARVPSPQELRAHTQQIMQNALIKKKLEEQKENYRKRQEMQESQTTNVNKFPDTGSSLKATNPGLSPSLSIIPTSVMRKMQVGKDKDMTKMSSVGSTPPQQQQQPTSLHSLAQLGSEVKVGSHSLMSQSAGGVLYSSDLEKIQKQTQLQQQQQQQRPVLGQSFTNGPVLGRGPMILASNVATNPTNHLSLPGRRIVKSNQPGQQGQQQQQQQQQQQRVMAASSQLLANQNKGYLAGPSGIDITKQLLQQQAVAAAAAAQRQLNISPMSALGHPGMVPIRGATNLHNAPVNPVRPPVNLTSNNFLMRNIVHPAPALSQFNQVAAYQRGVDPRQLQSKATQQYVQPHNMHSLAATSSMLMGVGGGSSARTTVPINSRPIQASYPSTMDAVLRNRGGVMGPTDMGNVSTSGRESPPGSSFDKWFSSDLRHKMPNMPPVPTQKAQYVEEVEQRQQQTTTVQN